MAELHLLARLNGKCGDALGLDLGDEFRDAARDLDTILVELALPQETGQHRAA